MRRFSVTMMAIASVTALSSSPVFAQEAIYTDWKRMQPDSFLIDIDDMDDRCLVGAASTSVTVAECAEAKEMLQAGQCRYEPIPDGTRYEFLMGLRNGIEHVYLNKTKRLGVSRMAFSCTVSTGRVIDWYAGEDRKSCGNVAARPLKPRMTPPPAKTYIYVPPAPLPVPMERPRQTTTIWQTPGYTYGGGVFSTGCPCCGQIVFGTPTVTIPGQVNQTTTFGF